MPMDKEFELGDILVQIGDTQKWVVDEIRTARDGHPEGFSIEYTLWRKTSLPSGWKRKCP